MRWIRLPSLGRPRVVDHYISCARKEGAERLRAAAEAEGFSVTLEKPTRLQWVVTMSHTANPSPWYQRRMERKWKTLAATVKDGHYDGWGTVWGYEDPPGWSEPTEGRGSGAPQGARVGGSASSRPRRRLWRGRVSPSPGPRAPTTLSDRLGRHSR